MALTPRGAAPPDATIRAGDLPPAAGPANGGHPPVRDLCVLCVDDDPDIRTIIALSLGLDPEITAILASDATEALAHLDRGLRPDVLLSDHHLPTLSGMELVERVRQHGYRPLPLFLLLTASVRPAEVAEFEAAGVAGVIRKPFDPIDLPGEIRRLVDLAETGGPGRGPDDRSLTPSPSVPPRDRPWSAADG